MKISQPTPNPVVVSSNVSSLAAQGGQAVGAQGKTAAPKGSPSAGVAVTVSPLARALESSSSDESADVDMDKINAVRSAIADGTYVVNPGVIADKLLSNAAEMLRRSKA